ncbi:hypothetical protein D9758_008879 [Tetrapyrgos nigripes]|uniref:Uncharacterized protein n=1 Tax=Tetrapyrgos nigripes TaxID=182062 RepID=A0A8H5CLS2_9AGAR|nr:hypothetical protein D9758_008879 [Tetrapyrgos nigripes]
MAEKLAAIASPVALWISELDEKHMSDKGGCLADVIDIELKRGKNFQNMAQFVFCCHEVDSEAFPSGRKFEEFLNQQEELKQNMKKSIDAALQQFARIASDPRLNSAFTELKARVAPVEFVFIAVLLFLMDEASDKEQAYAVYHLREAIRDRFPDLRMRNDVVELMWAYVKALAQEPNNDLCRVAAKSNKRKRKPSSKLRKEDSDTDYKPTRSAKKSRT